MGVRTSVYLSDGLHAAAKASGVGLGELVRRGLEARTPEEAVADLAVAGCVAQLREIASQAAREAQDGVYEALPEYVDRAVKAALREAQGGSW